MAVGGMLGGWGLETKEVLPVSNKARVQSYTWWSEEKQRVQARADESLLVPILLLLSTKG